MSIIIRNIFCHLKLGHVLAIAASNVEKYIWNNSAGQGLAWEVNFTIIIHFKFTMWLLYYWHTTVLVAHYHYTTCMKWEMYLK